MAANQAVKHVGFLSRHIQQKPQENLCIRPVVLDICTRYQARRIFCVRCGNQKPNGGVQDAGCAVGMECGGNGMANSIEWTWSDRSKHEQSNDPSKTEESGVDIVVNTEIDDLHLQAPALIESATQRLRPNGILMIALPFRSNWEIVLITARTWWERWNGGHTQFWSRRRLSALLESRGFMNLESIKIRASSRRRQIMILVAKKIVQLRATSP